MTDNPFRVKNGLDIANSAITANSTVLNLNSARISANGSTGSAGQAIFSDGTKNYYDFIVSTPGAPPGSNTQVVFNDSGSSNAIANFSFNKTTNTLSIGTGTISATTYTGSANNASYLGGIAAVNYQTTAGLSGNVATLTANNTSFVGTTSAANVVSNTQLQSNLANYQTTAGLSDNVATLTANNTSFVGTTSSANVVSNTQLQSNLANYQTSAGLSANVATLTANNTTYISGYPIANVVTTSTTKTTTIGYTITPYNKGTFSSFTVDPSLGNYQYGTNNGAFTLTAPASDCAVDLLITNGASAGSITFSGFTVGSNIGDALTTTNTSKFLVSMRRINGVSTYMIKALQ